jgi:hypothetical protein
MRFMYYEHNQENMKLKSNTRPTATKAQEKLLYAVAVEVGAAPLLVFGGSIPILFYGPAES